MEVRGTCDIRSVSFCLRMEGVQHHGSDIGHGSPLSLLRIVGIFAVSVAKTLIAPACPQLQLASSPYVVHYITHLHEIHHQHHHLQIPSAPQRSRPQKLLHGAPQFSIHSSKSLPQTSFPSPPLSRITARPSVISPSGGQECGLRLCDAAVISTSHDGRSFWRSCLRSIVM